MVSGAILISCLRAHDSSLISLFMYAGKEIQSQGRRMGLVAVFFACLLTFHLLLAAPALASSSKPGYQTFVIGGTPSTVVDKHVQQEGTWSVDLFHRDVLPTLKAQGKENHEMLQERLNRDAARVEAINQRVQLALMGAYPTDFKPSQSSVQVSAEDFSSPIVSGVTQGSGEYFTRFGIGTPAKQSYFVMDTGSDLSWTQCQPCSSCYKQTDPIFNPSASSSFHSVSCPSSLCNELQVSACRRGQCLYQVSYGDGSFTVGNFAQETFEFGTFSVKDVSVGCGHDNEGLFVGASGLLGLGAGKLSFPSQINSDFSYCLADRFAGGSSALIFGTGAVPAGTKFTSMLKNPKLSTFYYVPLEGISVGGSALSLSPADFSFQSSGSGGVILDSGTSVTRLVSSAYTPLRDAFRAGTTNLQSTTGFSLFDTCYNLAGMQSVDVPTVDLHFAGGATLSLPASNYLFPVDTMGTYCFAFAPSPSDLSIIGNVQQQGFRISFSSRVSQVGFAPNQC